MKKNLVEVVRSESKPEEVLEKIVDACLEANGKNISVLDVSNICDIADYYIVVTGRSDRQVLGIGNRVLEATGKIGETPYSVEGVEVGHWLLMDYGDIVVHIFYEPTREYYDVDNLWSKASKVPLSAALKQKLDAA